MRSKALILAGILMVSVAQAQERNAPTAESRKVGNAACAQVGEVAESIMRPRLDNTPMSTMMKRLDETVGAKTDEFSFKYAEFLRGLVMTAYRSPAYRTPENRQGAIADFRNEAELACFSGGI